MGGDIMAACASENETFRGAGEWGGGGGGERVKTILSGGNEQSVSP